MRKLHSNYPLGQLLIEILSSSGLNLPNFMRAIGYRNVNKGIRAFQQFLHTGFGNPDLITRISTSPYAPHPDGLVMILGQNMELIDQKLCQEYGVEPELRAPPLLHGAPSLSEVSFISLSALRGDLDSHTIRLPRWINSLSEHEQHTIIANKIRRHGKKTATQPHCLGPIQYYLYYHSWSEPPTVFSLNGAPLGVAEHAFLPRHLFCFDTKVLQKEILGRVVHSASGSTIH